MRCETKTIITAAIDMDKSIPPQHRRRIEEALAEAAGRREITEREAARLLCVAHSTLGRWRRGELRPGMAFPFRCFVTPGGRVLYWRDEVEAYAIENYGGVGCSRQSTAG